MAKQSKSYECKLGEAPRSEQAPQFIEDCHCSDYDNDTQGWLRGIGTKPSFDTKKAKR